MNTRFPVFVYQPEAADIVCPLPEAGVHVGVNEPVSKSESLLAAPVPPK